MVKVLVHYLNHFFSFRNGLGNNLHGRLKLFDLQPVSKVFGCDRTIPVARLSENGHDCLPSSLEFITICPSSLSAEKDQGGRSECSHGTGSHTRVDGIIAAGCKKDLISQL